jgi:flagellar hook-associated protein 2
MATISGTTQGNFDVASIVSQLMAVERRPLTKLAQREAGIQSKISAYGSVKGALSGFQTAFANLNNLATYKAVKVSSSDETQVKAAATANAPAGAHSVRITNLASAHAIATGNYPTPDTAIGTGTLTFQRGTFSGSMFTANPGFATKAVTIAAAQNTVTGIRDAVNAANIGVSTSIVNDGTGYRLVFSSADGSANSLKLTASDEDGSDTNAAGLSALAFDPAATAGNGKNLIEMRGAQDAIAIIDGITVSSSSNSISSAIDGVTFTANNVSTSTATVRIEQDNGGIKTGIDAFIKAYNDLSNQLKQLSAFDAASRQAGPLNGDSTLRALQSELRTLVSAKVSTTGSLRGLSDVGIALDKNGLLQLDSTKLQKQMDLDRGAIAQLFAKAGQTSDSRVSFLKATDRTRIGIYEVSVSQAATQGKLVGNQVAGLTFNTGVNDTLNLTVDGIQASIILPARTYASATELAADLQSRVSGNITLSSAGVGVLITNVADQLTITSVRYGAASGIAASGNGSLTLFGNAPTATTGLDVVGTIGGISATGNGQVLAGTGAVLGLELKINTSVTGGLGAVKYFEGITAKLDARITELSGPKGPLKARTDGLDASVKDIGKLTTDYNARLVRLEQRYRRQFSTLDATLGRMSTTSTYLQQQLAAIAKNTAR